jgi:hypothetical protein
MTSDGTQHPTATSPPASIPTVEAQAQAIRLEREVQMLTELLGELTPYEGELPATLEQYQSLPAAHRRQLATRNPQHIQDLWQVEELLTRAAASDKQEEQRRSELAGLDIDSPAAFAALDAPKRAALAMTLTRGQRLALCGGTPLKTDEAYL